MKSEVHIAKAIIVNQHNQVLITQRPSNHKRSPNAWTTPAGHIEYGETAEEAVIREIKEEVDLDVTIRGFLGIAEMKAIENPLRTIYTHYFFAETEYSTVHLEEREFQAFEWISADKILIDERLAQPVRDMCKLAFKNR